VYNAHRVATGAQDEGCFLFGSAFPFLSPTDPPALLFTALQNSSSSLQKKKSRAERRMVKRDEYSDHGRDRTCNLLIPIVLIVVKRLAIGPRGH
jgi:hypothetical protein